MVCDKQILTLKHIDLFASTVCNTSYLLVTCVLKYKKGGDRGGGRLLIRDTRSFKKYGVTVWSNGNRRQG